MEIFFGTKSDSVNNVKVLSQIHSNKVLIVENQSQNTEIIEADSLITTLSGIKLSVKTADCAPILLYSQSVVAAVHAGWRGAYSGIIQNTVKTMQDLGSDEIKAYIGPCIRQDNYQVDEEFYKKFIEQSSENERFFDNLYFDLPCYCKAILNDLGVSHIIDEYTDTYTNPEKFYSYRYYTKNNLELQKHERQFSYISL